MKIYFLYDKEWKSDTFYVGKAVNLKKRISGHNANREINKNNSKSDWLKTLKNNKCGIYEICNVPQYMTWQEAEKEWIGFLRWCGIKLCNANSGGGGIESGELHPNYGKSLPDEVRKKISKNHHDVSGDKNPMYGKHHTEETLKKISDKNTGRKLTDEHKKKISDFNKNKILSDEHKEKISISNTGKVFSEEHKSNLSKSKQGKNIGKDNPFFGKHHTEEVKGNLSKLHTGTRHEQEVKNKIKLKAKRGEEHYNSKLTKINIIEIRDMIKSGIRIAAIARIFNVSWQTIKYIKIGKTWNDID